MMYKLNVMMYKLLVMMYKFLVLMYKLVVIIYKQIVMMYKLMLPGEVTAGGCLTAISAAHYARTGGAELESLRVTTELIQRG